MVSAAYCYIVDDFALVTDDSGVLGVVEDDEDWNLGDVPLSRYADVRPSLRLDFTVIQAPYSELNLAVSDKAGDAFGVALHDLDALQDCGEARGSQHSIRMSRAVARDRRARES